jgi:endonuclease/exonuclease/phosphatase family metal-dependent hydrolase
MKKLLLTVVGTVMAFSCLSAYADYGKSEKTDIKVMTQNQYLGADLGPVIAATPEQYPFAIVNALQSIAINNIPERAATLAQSIAERKPDLVALQEVYDFRCTSLVTGYDACSAFPGAFNDHLALTEAALDDLGSDYVVVAVLQNMTIPALPVFLPGIGDAENPTPAMIVSVIDRDVILARSDVEASLAPIPCARPAPVGNGCHYQAVATVPTPLGDITVERGFVGVNATVKGQDYLFVNTHLEIRMLGSSEESTALQPLQASELVGTLAAYLPYLPQAPRVIIAGDFNNGPENTPLAPYFIETAYQQLSVDYTDTWTLRHGEPKNGFTCCQAADLLNGPSSLDERIDIVFANPAPAKTKTAVLNAKSDDKTASGLWPSDHASVFTKLTYQF